MAHMNVYACLFWSALICAVGACVPGLPEGCDCKNYSSGHAAHASCFNNTHLTEFPDLPPATNMVFKNIMLDIISTVPYGERVQYISITYCGVRLVEDGAFEHLTNLRNLHLGHNEISSVRRLTFRGLDKLKYLSLSDNPLFRLRTGTFTSYILPQLEQLYVDRAELYTVEDKAFDGLPNLNILAMTHNHLRAVPVLGCSGKSLANLLTWDMSHNEISEMSRLDCEIPNFQLLDLSYNRIQMLNASFLGTSLMSLKILRLGHNDLWHVHPSALKDCKNLTHIDLSYNRLSVLENRTIPWNEVETVLIHDNPWDCGCVNHWLVDEIPVARYNAESAVRCGTPEKWANMTVTAVDENVFKSCAKPHHSNGHVIGIVMGVIFGLVGLFICFIVLYRMATRKLVRQNQNNASQSSTSPRRTTSSTYARMDAENDVTFDYEANNDESQVPSWDNSQMPNWDTQSPISNQHSNFRV